MNIYDVFETMFLIGLLALGVTFIVVAVTSLADVHQVMVNHADACNSINGFYSNGQCCTIKDSNMSCFNFDKVKE